MAPKLPALVIVSLLSFLSTAIGPAATVVPEKSAAGAPLFQFETVQVTDAVIQRLKKDAGTSESGATKLVTFGEGPGANDRGNWAGECKTFPGDEGWPKGEIWDELNSLLGGALISTVPVAAPCYNSEWGPKDIVKCNDVISKFGTPPLQYV